MILLNNPTIQQSNNPTIQQSNNRTIEQSNNRTIEQSNNRTIQQSNNPTIQIALPRDSSLLHFNVKSVLLTLEQMFH
jgi:hypothetical protein